MERVKVIGGITSVLLLVAAVTWSALPLQENTPPGVPESGVAHEPAAGSLSNDGRAASPGRPGGSSPASSPSLVSRVLSFVLPPRTESEPVAVPAPPAPAAGRIALVPRADAKGGMPASISGLALVPDETPRAPAPETKQTVAILAKAQTSGAASGAPAVSAGNPDADEDAPAPADHAAKTYAEANPGVVRGVPRSLPVRDHVGASATWYDEVPEEALAARSSRVAGGDDDAAVVEPLGSGAAAAGTSSGRPSAGVATGSGPRQFASAPIGGAPARPSVAATAKTGSAGAGFERGAPSYRVVRLRATREDATAAASASRASAKGLAAPASGAAALPVPPIEGTPAVTVASLGPKLPGAGGTAYPGLAAPRPEGTPKPTSFCPMGTVEKKTKTERYCARVDKSGVTFREGPVAFLNTQGKKTAQGNYVNGRLEGAYVEYGPKGKVAEGTYKAGKKHGAWTFWWENGKKQSEGSFVAGDRTGVWTYYDETGRKTSQGELRTVGNVEKKQGRWVFWQNGVKKQEGTFVNGRKDGAWKTYDERGKVVSTVLFRDGDEEIR